MPKTKLQRSLELQAYILQISKNSFSFLKSLSALENKKTGPSRFKRLFLKSRVEVNSDAKIEGTGQPWVRITELISPALTGLTVQKPVA